VADCRTATADPTSRGCVGSLMDRSVSAACQTVSDRDSRVGLVRDDSSRVCAIERGRRAEIVEPAGEIAGEHGRDIEPVGGGLAVGEHGGVRESMRIRPVAGLIGTERRAPARKGEQTMRPLRYSINVTLDGCVDHREGIPDEGLHRHHAENLQRADALIFGKVTYQMMEEAWRKPPDGNWPDWMDDWMVPFAEIIDGAKKYVVSSTLDRVDWNAELVQGEPGEFVRQLKQAPGDGLAVGGVTLPLALAKQGLIDEYEFVVQPVVAGHGPRLLDGLTERLALELVGRQELGSGAVVLRYQPRRPSA